MQRTSNSAIKAVLNAKSSTASLASMLPTFEHIVTDVTETFLWRMDNYPWDRNVWNYHPEIEVHLIRKSSGVAFVGDYIGDFQPGYLTMVGAGLPHDWVTALSPGEVIPGRDIVIQFHPDHIQAASKSIPELAELGELFIRAQRGLAFTGDAAKEGTELVEQMGNLKGFARLNLFFQLLELLSQTPEYEILSSPEFSPRLDPETLDVLQRCLIYIFQNFASDIRLADVASLSGMSETAFSRFFKKNSGNSFTDHVNKLRIWQACKLLAETDVPVTDICFEVGYMNISNFNRTFLKAHRMTPSAYRRLTSHRRASR